MEYAPSTANIEPKASQRVQKLIVEARTAEKLSFPMF